MLQSTYGFGELRPSRPDDYLTKQTAVDPRTARNAGARVAAFPRDDFPSARS